MDAAAAGHITNLGFLDGEEPNQSDAPVLNSDLLAVDPPTPAEPYLAPRYGSADRTGANASQHKRKDQRGTWRDAELDAELWVIVCLHRLTSSSLVDLSESTTKVPLDLVLG